MNLLLIFIFLSLGTFAERRLLDLYDDSIQKEFREEDHSIDTRRELSTIDDWIRCGNNEFPNGGRAFHCKTNENNPSVDWCRHYAKSEDGAIGFKWARLNNLGHCIIFYDQSEPYCGGSPFGWSPFSDHVAWYESNWKGEDFDRDGSCSDTTDSPWIHEYLRLTGSTPGSEWKERMHPKDKVLVLGEKIEEWEVCENACEDVISDKLPYCFYNKGSGSCWGAQSFYMDYASAFNTWYGYDNKALSGRGHREKTWDEGWGIDLKGNRATIMCANEGDFCPCQGVVTYTKKCGGFWSCDRLSWGALLGKNYSRRHAQVRGGISCTNSAFGTDPWPGHDKQCYCHPASHEGTEYGAPPPNAWSKESCKKRFGGMTGFFKGFFLGMSCTFECPLRAATLRKKGNVVANFGGCTHSCYCVVNGWV